MGSAHAALLGRWKGSEMNNELCSAFDKAVNEKVAEALKKQQKPVPQGPVRIFVMDRAWVLVGRVAAENEKSFVLEDANVVRYWGTTKGLGEIAECGPTPKTKLDREGAVSLNKDFVLKSIQCVSSAWEGKL